MSVQPELQARRDRTPGHLARTCALRASHDSGDMRVT